MYRLKGELTEKMKETAGEKKQVELKSATENAISHQDREEEVCSNLV